MTKKDLQEIFESSFDCDNWRKVIDFVFPELQFLANPYIKDITTRVDEYNIDEIRIRGNTTLSDNIHLTLAEVALKNSVNLPRNVKGVRKSITDEVIANTQVTIAVFHSPDKTKWRFTLAVKKLTEDFKEVDHKPHSFTYVFGKNEKGRTAADRFYKLASIDKKKLSDLEEAFSVTSLSKRFFEQYKFIYARFVEDIINNPLKLNLFKEEDRDKSARDFVKKMMGRIVFLYFLQKKGWMGCKTKWQEGDEWFMQHFFCSATKDETFYPKYLAPLFFETLNKRREEQDEDCIINGGNYGKVPFLNGGLFERETSHPDHLTFNWEIFNEFFQILEGYNFTIIEDDPDYKEVAVDPEMLGHIFENLLEDNKDKGAFYTPKEIVQYMCRESLIEYLYTKLSVTITSHRLKDAIRRFVEEHAFADLNNLDQNADRYVLEALRDVKICDPAIGSGAFPMGILIEMCHILEAFEFNDVFRTTWGMAEWNPALIKQAIVQNSIYGVDIEKGAVDIARLRFWLSIMIDEEEPKPLPNLDYKIVVGDSLLNKFEDHVIDIEWEVKEGTQIDTKTEVFLKRRSNLLKQISDKQRVYFDAESSHRDKLNQEIKNLKIDILVNQLEMMVASEGITKKPQEHNFSRKSKFVEAQRLHFQTIEWQEAIRELNSIKEINKPFNHFDWNLDFPEVLNPIINNDVPGFDIVIGNPPYDVYEGEKVSELSFLREKWIYKIAKGGKLNAYKLFIGKSIEVTKNSGIYCLIFQNSFLADKEAIGVRKENIINQKIIKIDSFPERDNKKKRVFESVKMSVCILLAKKKIKEDYSFILNVWKNKWMKDGFSTPFSKSEIIDIDQETYQFPMIKPEEKKTFIKFYKPDFGIYRFGDILSCYRGELNMTTQRPYFTSVKNLFAALKGAQIQKYIISDNMSQGELEYVLKDKYLEENHGPKSTHFLQDRCVTQRITGVNERFRLKAAILQKNTFCADSCNYILGNDDYPISIIMLLLNSTLYNWAFKKTSTNSNVNSYEVENMSLPLIGENIKNHLIHFAEKIVNEKGQGLDTTDIERKIDVIVYKLFKLTYHEVKLVEPEFRLSEEQYNNTSLEEII